MIVEALAAAAVAGIAQRPFGLTHGDAQGYSRWLGERALTADRAFGRPACASAQVVSLGGAPLHPSQAAGEPGRRGAPLVFFEHVRVTGCSGAVTLNLQVVPNRRGGWDGIGLLPGNAASSPREQTEAMQAVASTIVNGEPRLPCLPSKALLSSTNGEVRVVSPPAAPGRPWTERWPMKACGEDRTVEVTFSPQPRGPATATVRPAWDAGRGSNASSSDLRR